MHHSDPSDSLAFYDPDLTAPPGELEDIEEADCLIAAAEKCARFTARKVAEIADPEDMAIELEEVRAASCAELDAAFEAGCEDWAFSPERWREGKARAAYIDGWNRCNCRIKRFDGDAP